MALCGGASRGLSQVAETDITEICSVVECGRWKVDVGMVQGGRRKV